MVVDSWKWAKFVDKTSFSVCRFFKMWDELCLPFLICSLGVLNARPDHLWELRWCPRRCASSSSTCDGLDKRMTGMARFEVKIQKLKLIGLV